MTGVQTCALPIYLKWENVCEEGPHEAKFLKLDCSHIKYALGWKPCWDIRTAIEKTVEWTRVNALANREIVLIAPGKTSETEKDRVKKYIEREAPVVIGVNAVNISYEFDYLSITLHDIIMREKFIQNNFQKQRKYYYQILKLSRIRMK